MISENTEVLNTLMGLDLIKMGFKLKYCLKLQFFVSIGERGLTLLFKTEKGEKTKLLLCQALYGFEILQFSRCMVLEYFSLKNNVLPN